MSVARAFDNIMINVSAKYAYFRLGKTNITNNICDHNPVFTTHIYLIVTIDYPRMEHDSIENYWPSIKH